MGKTALEPFWEARFEGSSYGFRPGRGCHEAIQKRFYWGRPNTKRPWVLDADLEGACDHIGHSALVPAIGHFPARGLVKQWRNAGYGEDARQHPTDTGVPQGGVRSPLLLNVARHGLEHALGSSYTPRGTLRGTSALVRYAADLAVLCPTQQAAIDAQPLLAMGLGTRGLRWSAAQPHMRHLTEGFDFLGFNIRHDPVPQSSRRGDKRLITPSQGSIQQIQRKLKARWRQQVGSPTVARINAMNPLISGWRQYFRIGVASRVFADLDAFMYARAQRDMQRRHPRQAGWWRPQKYWGQTRGPRRDRWVFQDHERHATLRQFAWTRMVRHRLAPKTYSPDDPPLQDYWRQRQSRPQALADRPRHLASRQQGCCPVCLQGLENGAALHVHHVLPKQHGGTDDLANLCLVHANCHRQSHSRSAPLGVRRWLEPCTR